ncbi:lytic polysaccharide monooxygenase [Thermopolyspora sp. NPDC052614]|uniref:lytic polysaccharide monooxygenase auxiliary activity family 9 protein n=1 Tax=Thermopolyspora sp. NPDC052614 TaxID=3155682 RepID=UPI003440964B
MTITGNARRTASLAALVAASTLLPPAFAGPAYAHGTMNNPPSRALVCYNENPESPDSAACKQAIAMGGTQPFYDWNEVNIADAAGRHRQIIPDGKLCSAGRDKYRGLDQARADWPATPMPDGGRFTFTYRATAPHRGSFELYITKDGYDPTRPLRWSDLESRPFATVTDPPLANGAYTIEATLPSGKRGRHLIYSIWQRSDSPEAFYTCSDVVFGGGSGSSAPGNGQGNPTANPTSAPTAVPTSAPTTAKPVTPPPTTAPTHDHEHPLPSPTPTSGKPAPADPLSRIAVGAGVQPARVTRGQAVTVTAVCAGSRVVSVASNAFARRTVAATARSATWYPTVSVSNRARSGVYAVYVRCADGGLARAALTVG